MALRRPLAALFVLAPAVGVLACSDSTEPAPPPIVSLVVAGLPDTAGVADTLQATAVARDSSGAPLGAVAVRWRSLDAAVATVDSSGRVVVRDVGVVRIVASARGRTTVEDTVAMHTLRLPSRIALSGLAPTVALGTSDTASAIVRDGRGEVLAAPARWSSSNRWVLEVDSTTGTVIARGAGTAWVRARAGRAQDSVRIDVPIVPLMPGHDWLQVAGTTLGGPFATCALESSGQVWCEGATGTPQLVPGAARLRDLRGGQAQYCGLDAQGVVHCFGSDGARVFGVYDVSRRPFASDSLYPGGNGVRFLRYDLGEHQAACGIQAADSVVYCWGHNDAGQVGRLPLSSADSVVAPIAGNLKATQLDLTGFSGCAMAIDRSVSCWGEASYFGGAAKVYEPQQVQPPGRFTAVASGNGTACGLSADGVASCWGRSVGRWEEGGVPAATPRALAGSLRFTRVVARDYGSEFCGLTAAGSLHCWDAFEDRGLPAMTPVAVLPGRTVTSVTLARYRRCAVVTGGDAFCF